jgi:hypothetical protein
MTTQEIKDTIQDLKDGIKSSFTPEQFKPRMEAKIKELEAKLTKTSEPAKIVKMPVQPERKKSVPQPKEKEEKYPEDEDDYCAKVIAQAKERRAKARERAKEPKKTEATKNVEKIDKVFENVKERAENDEITKSELVKLISETKSLLTLLEKKLASL